MIACCRQIRYAPAARVGATMTKSLLCFTLFTLMTTAAVSHQALPVPQFTPDPDFFKLPPDFKWGQVIGIFADSRGHVWTSSSGRISEWDPQGKRVQSWDARGPDGKWSTIHGLFVDHNNFVWTNARESNLTVKFTREGKVVLVIGRSEEHTSELQSLAYLVCRLLLEKKKTQKKQEIQT